MARYRITYDNGVKDIVAAATVDRSIDGNEYRFHNADGRAVAYIPAINVYSIILTEEPEAVTD